MSEDTGLTPNKFDQTFIGVIDGKYIQSSDVLFETMRYCLCGNKMRFKVEDCN